ncbi:hypothetical protein SLEP1_g21738 [Rubroshorea leprosula]|uniref:Uncharacterized protein n=1 Tax=Rubroshorea leprosula TaxID=152421 RepID=A0AAV5JA32_9ROSI|nr:hypothetical protein SLEP1_g21738 [Rubroshorea leprosula]
MRSLETLLPTETLEIENGLSMVSNVKLLRRPRMNVKIMTRKRVLRMLRRSYPRGGKQEPDTIVLRGVPSRWFAEPRVSSKPSMLVTRTTFSLFGKIR